MYIHMANNDINVVGMSIEYAARKHVGPYFQTMFLISKMTHVSLTY